MSVLAQRRYPFAALLYIGALWVLTVGLAVFVVLRYGEPVRYEALVLLALVGILSWRIGPNTVDEAVQFAASNIIMLAAIAMLRPIGAGLVGLFVAAFRPGPQSRRGRLFNMAMFASVAMCGAIAYDQVGGQHNISAITGAGPLIRHVGLPLAAADLVITVLNALLLSGILTITRGVPFRIQVARLLGGTGFAYLAHGLLAFLLVVLWMPAGLGWTSVLFTLALLLGARWAITQYGEERRAHERSLDVLVAAIETRAPLLLGHSARVASLAGNMAEELGLRPQQVSDVRQAGMIHDVGLLTLPPGTPALMPPATQRDEWIGGETEDYAERGADLIRGVSFLSGALEAVAHHGPKHADTPSTLAADIVRVADEYDLLTSVASHAERLDHSGAVHELRAMWPPHPPRVVEALERAHARTDQAHSS
jgi:HD-GYP domain-containing protein (c-di-GMP phosphodiesterase class II)